MNKVEYIDQLVKYLKPYQIEDKYSIIANYEQIIDEILLDFDNDFNEVIHKLGSPQELANEIKLEFGYHDEIKDAKTEEKADTNKQEEKQENTKFSSGNQYERKRQKSNGIWYAFSFIVVIIQFGLFLSLVLQSYLFIAFGLNAKVEIASQRYNGLSDNMHVVRICNDQKCYGFNVNESIYHNVSHVEIVSCEGHRHCNLQMQGMNRHINIQIGWIGFVTISFNVFLMIVIHIFIYRNIKKIIKSNDEYNRLRNY